jgi:hypothetical protein
MSTRYTRSVLAAAVVTCAFAGSGGGTAIAHDHKMPVVAIGCLQSEREYRRQHESSKFAGTGYGLNDEYVLIDAVIGGPDMNIEPVTEDEANCVTGQGTGQAFELTGHGEDRNNLSSYLGRRVAIRGMLKHAKHDVGPVGTSGTFTPLGTDGGPSLGTDLKLREINVEGASLVPVRVIAEAEPVIHPAPEPEPVPAPVAEAPAPQTPAPIAPAPQAPARLPKTASPLPAIGLLGLMSLALGAGLRLFNRRARVAYRSSP